MVELLKKYKIAVICLVLVILNVSWYSVKEMKSKEVSIKLSSESYNMQLLESEDINTMTSLEEEKAADIPQAPLDLQQNDTYWPTPTTQVPVYICGEIVCPGVYYVDPAAIINDVVQMGGGLTLDADKNYLNLASRVAPNQKIYVPKIGEEIDKSLNSYDNKDIVASQETSISGSKMSEQGYSHIININTATEKDLQTLSGIGAVKARAIIEYRMTIGRFKKVDELLNVSGIGDKTLEKIRAFITV
ncbi:helix-hairpin-helix domain-containing protein [Cellulosilyticum sp. I15G10I2]|uniref:helix-hairpin-helix domain-containing protein n=1 Tax=Cellulosilyticum sp. I15G10I2 TaxID=1892843 RepID=UPI00085C78AE|nr:helix-hairpin-helix domain-containing protein [Cellulosilyticum sp. I15G10I2]